MPLRLLVTVLILSGCSSNALLSPHQSPSEGPRRPNVILILADDLGFGAFGAYNPDSLIEKSHLYRLAA